MAIKEIVAQVRAKLSDEEVSKVSDLLSQITREEIDLQGELSSANYESKTRKGTIRDLQKIVDGKSDSKEDYESKLAKKDAELGELKGFKEKFETFQAKELKDTTVRFDKIVKGLSVDETDPKYETYKKVLDKFTLAGKDETLTIEQIKANSTIYEYAKEFGALNIDEGGFDDGKNQQGNKTDDKKTAFETFLSE